MQTAGSNTVVLSMGEKMTREKLVQVLERGKESATHIKRLIDHHDHQDDDPDDGGFLKLLKGQVDAHSLEVFISFTTALSMIPYNFPSFDHQNLKRATPVPHPRFKSEEFGDWEATQSPKDGRGCYKRRKTEQSMEIETSNMDDGYAWRKYGQKVIQHTNHPRHYYRCTHKSEQGCPATKQVQQISDNPPKYKVIYHGHHTCKCPFRTPALYRDLNDDQDDSSILLSFEKPNKPKHGFSPFMLPLSWSSSTTSTAPMSNAMVEQEYNPFKNGIPLEPVDQHHGAHIQCPPSSDFVSTTSDLTTNTFVSDNVISLAEIYSSAVSPYDVEEDYSCMMTESFDFIDVFQDNYLLCA